MIKDALVKFKRLEGFHCPFVAGWDCHGLPIEHAVCKTLDPMALDPVVVRSKCRAYATSWVNQQMSQLKDLGISNFSKITHRPPGLLADWERSYFTMSSSYEAEILRVFGKFVEQGFVEWKLKTVTWCPSCCTTLSKAELEHKTLPSPSCYVSFNLTKESQLEFNKTTNLTDVVVSLVAWTTQPYTLPMNQAVVLAPNGKYVVAMFKDKPGHAGLVGLEEFQPLKAKLQLEG